MRNFWLILSVLWLWTCSGGGDKATGPEEPPIVINLTSLGGQAQKGPFNNGTAINVAELTNTLSPTGRNFSSAITDNTGRFAVANVQLESPYIELRANGFYFNEVSNEISDAQLTLFAISNLTGKTSLNVNILTHLEKNRIVTLMSGDNPKTFAQAKLQAQEEVLAIFDYSRANVPESELLDISQDGAANAKLLAMSAIIQGNLTVGQMSQLLANISTDIASDGTLDDTNLRNTLIENSKNLNMEEVRSNLVAHYASLGISATIPDFETEINQFLKPPVAQDMSASTAEDTPINITLAASDPEGESLTYTVLEVNNATVTLNDNVATYTPDAHFNGTDTFTYYANDGTSDSNIATVTMTVSAEDDDPNTLDVATTTDEDVAVTVNLSAEEYDGDSYSFAIIDQPNDGSVSLNGASATYTPNQDWNGEDTFTFEATDDAGRNMNVATATITVNPINDIPTMRDTTFTFEEDCLTGGNDDDYCIDIDVLEQQYGLFNDVDSDASGASVTLDSEPQHGSLALQGSRFLYNPNKDWYGEDVMTYVVNDGDGGVSNVVSINLIATPVNDAPVVEDISTTIDFNFTGHTITIKGDNNTDVDGDEITFSIVNPPSNGNIYNDAGGGIPDGDALEAGDELTSGSTIYNPNNGFSGEDSFTFKATDGTLDSNIGTVNITVNPYTPESTLDLGDFDYLISMSPTNDGGYIVAGNAGDEGKIVKLSQYGESIEWTTFINVSLPSSDEAVFQCKELSNGNYAFIGQIWGQNKMFYGLLDSNGNEIYLNYDIISDGATSSRGNNLQELSNGNILTTSYEYDGNQNGIIAIYSSDFETLIDHKKIANTSFDWFWNNENIITDAADNFFITSNIRKQGYQNFLTTGNVDFQNVDTIELFFSKNVNITSILDDGSYIAVCGYTIENNDHDFFFGKIDKSGNIFMEKYYENFDGEQIATSIKKQSSSNYIVLGNHQSRNIVEILKIDESGDIVSSKKLNNTGGMSAHLHIYEADAKFIASWDNSSTGYVIRDSIGN